MSFRTKLKHFIARSGSFFFADQAGEGTRIGCAAFHRAGSAIPCLLAALGLAFAGRDMTSRTPIPFGLSTALAVWLVGLNGGAWMDPGEAFGGVQ